MKIIWHRLRFLFLRLFQKKSTVAILLAVGFLFFVYLNEKADIENIPEIDQYGVDSVIQIIDRQNGSPIINVLVNGLPVKMLFDTGASKSAITTEVAKKMNLPTSVDVIVRTANGVKLLKTAKVNSLVVGNIEKKNIDMIVIDQPMKFGLLGQDIYQLLDISIQQKFIRLRER